MRTGPLIILALSIAAWAVCVACAVAVVKTIQLVAEAMGS